MKHISHISKIIIIAITLLWFNMADGQTINDIKVDLDVKNKTLKEVFNIVERTSGLHFIYNDNLVSVYHNISIAAKSRTIASVLNELLDKTNLQFMQQNNKIIISEKDEIIYPKKEIIIIKGKVLEAGTDKPVPNVRIYFDGTLNGAISDSTGNFTLYPQENSNIPVIISAIGYYSEVIPDYPTGKKAIIYIKARQYDLPEVAISVSDGMPRKEKLKIFRKEFLGSSANARSCEILNESDIRLSYNKNTRTLKASSDNPIIVRNKNLGYTFNFVLESFTASTKATLFYGPQFFTDDLQQTNRRIEKARENTYLGSRMHFIKSLWNNELEKNGFEIIGYNILRNKVTYDDIVVTYNDKKYIRLKEAIKVFYKGKISFLYKNDTGKDLFIDKDGYNDPIGLGWGGTIGAQRAADLLPLEYGSYNN